MTDSSPFHQTHWFVFQDNTLLMKKNGDEFVLPILENVISLQNAFLRKRTLYSTDDGGMYSAELPSHYPIPDGMEFIPLRKALDLLGPNWYNHTVKAHGIMAWDKNHQYCGRCGTLTVSHTLLFERACPTCLLTFYPRISPSIIVLIQKGDHILMARSPHFPPGVYGLIAGFVEPGESVEEAVHREVREEIGVSIKNLHYFGSQPWPFPDSLMLAFTADYADGELVINPAEIETAGWYPVVALPGRPSFRMSIGNQLIEHVLAQQKERRDGIS